MYRANSLIAHLQRDLRCKHYSGSIDAINKSDTDAAQIGRKMILLRRFDGSDRQKSQLCQDAIVIMLWSRNLIFTDVILTLG